MLTRIAFQLNGVPQDPTRSHRRSQPGGSRRAPVPRARSPSSSSTAGWSASSGCRTPPRRSTTCSTADGWAPKLADGFGVEQEVRAIGARTNVPDGSDSWELLAVRSCFAAPTWPPRPTQVMHMSPWAIAAGQVEDRRRDAASGLVAAQAQGARAGAPLRGRAVRLGRHVADPQSPLGSPVAGGFDCSGLRLVGDEAPLLHRLEPHVDGQSPRSWPATTFDMAAQLPVSKRIHRRDLKPGDILFWSSRAERRQDEVGDRLPRRHLPRKRLGDQQPRLRRRRHARLHGQGRRLVPRRVRLRLARHAALPLEHAAGGLRALAVSLRR